MRKVIVIGGGAAGMMAALSAAKLGKQVEIYEKNEKLGKKVYITGKGRCNITNACDMEELFNNVVTNSRFLYSSFYAFNNYDVIDLFESMGISTKIERGNRVFPTSDHSYDIMDGFNREFKKLNVKIRYNSNVKDILIDNNKFVGILLDNGNKVMADSVIIATGGLSYKSTGSTGDGYEFAKKMGHNITKVSPSLVPFNIKEEYVKNLQGLSLRNINMEIYSNNKKIYSDFGEMLFTHFGVSGPLILSASAYIQKYLSNNDLKIYIDLKPALSVEQLDQRVLRDFEMYKNKKFENSLDNLLPKKFIPVIIQLSKINPIKRVNEVTKSERENLIILLKKFPMSIGSLRDYNEAIITKGGVNVKEVNPSSMESKIVDNVFFAGELLDLDAVTGGFNLQIAWSTGYLAGVNS